ncbi:MAG: hypothetical protein U0166_01195 [Acidobacteriota bacterium]
MRASEVRLPSGQAVAWRKLRARLHAARRLGGLVNPASPAARIIESKLSANPLRVRHAAMAAPAPARVLVMA